VLVVDVRPPGVRHLAAAGRRPRELGAALGRLRHARAPGRRSVGDPQRLPQRAGRARPSGSGPLPGLPPPLMGPPAPTPAGPGRRPVPVGVGGRLPRRRRGGHVPQRAVRPPALAPARPRRHPGRFGPGAAGGTVVAMRPVIQAATRGWARLPGPRGPAVMVLGYHRIDHLDDDLAVRPSTFAAQMDVLVSRRHDVPVLDLHDAVERLSGQAPPRRAVVLTFDDAWADNHTYALGTLVDRSLPATLYAPSQLLGKAQHLSPTQLLEMDAAGVTIGAHSRTHPDLRGCSDAELEAEV